MGQTLTHGIYLPDEGERNCYNGLAGNWQLLDGAVGTVAEHTSALAGKAPAVHTHTKADITDFPAYGNAAGTICEGNDSRLSDARTPIAHTHTKSDVTDLLNSNFIPSANNSYDLGSASYQWKSIYAESYYYNGTAWGLNKSNTWGESNTFTKRVFFQSGYSQVQATAFDIRTNPEVNRGRDLFTIWDGTASANGNYLGGMAYSQETDGSSRLQLICFGYPTSGNAYQRRINFHSYRDGSASFYPVQNNITNLGTATNKWKSLNGINPGALSLPDCQVTQSIDRTGWVYDGATYNTVLLATTDINMTKNGWLYVRMASTTSSDKLTIKYNSTADKYPTNTFIGAGGSIEVFVPVVADTNLYLLATKDLSFCKFYPCLGNVPSGV